MYIFTLPSRKRIAIGIRRTVTGLGLILLAVWHLFGLAGGYLPPEREIIETNQFFSSPQAEPEDLSEEREGKEGAVYRRTSVREHFQELYDFYLVGW